MHVTDYTTRISYLCAKFAVQLFVRCRFQATMQLDTCACICCATSAGGHEGTSEFASFCRDVLELGEEQVGSRQ